MTRRTLNTKLLAVLFFGTIGLGVGAFFLHRFMTDRAALALEKNAEQAEKKGDLAKAIEYYNRYLDSRNNPEIAKFAKVGLLYDQYGMSIDEANEARAIRSRALPLFLKALQSNPNMELQVGPNPDDTIPIRKAFVNLMVTVGQQPEQFLLAKTHINDLIKDAEATKTPDTAELAKLYGQRGKIFERLSKFDGSEPGKFEDAISNYSECLKTDPKQVEFYKPYAMVLRNQLNLPVDADKVIADLVKHNKTVPAYLDSAAYHIQFGNFDAARADVDALEKLAPNDAKVVLARVAFELQQPNKSGNLDIARERLDKGMELYPKNLQLYLARANLEALDNKAEAAEHALELALKHIPQSEEAALILANLYIDDGKVPLARPIIERFKKSSFPLAIINLLDARILVAEGAWDKALAALTAVAPTLEHGYHKFHPVQAYMELARCYQHFNKVDEEINSYQRVVTIDPDNTLARINLSSALLRQSPDNADRALSVLQGSAADSIDARLMQIRLLAGNIAQQPASQRDWTPVLQQLDALDKEKPGNLQVLILRTSVDLAQGQIEKASQALKTARAAAPDRVELWIIEAQFNQQIGRLNEALSLLEEADRKFPDRVEPFIARVQFWSQQNDVRSRQALINLIPRIKSFPEVRQSGLTQFLVQALSRVGANTEALALIQNIASKNPDDSINIQSLIFDIALRTANHDLARATIDKLRNIEGADGTQWRIAEAAMIVAQARSTKNNSELSKAKKLLEQTRDNRPARVYVLEADIAKLEGLTDQAIEALKNAIDKGERSAPVIRELVQLYYSEKRYDEADAAIQKLRDKGSSDTDMKRYAAMASLNFKDKDQALRMAKQAIDPNSKDFRDHVWMGQLLAAAGDAKAAEQSFEKAVSLAPQTRDSWLALVQFYIRDNRRPDAEKTLERARAALPPEVAALALAQGYRIVGRNDVADDLFKNALAANPNDPVALQAAASHHLNQGHLDRAEPLLQSLIKPDVAQNYRVWARRSLALGLLDSGSPDRVKESLALVEANLKESPESYADLYAHAAILTAFPARRQEAIEEFQKLPKQPGLNQGGADLVLAQLYESDGKWNEARELFAKLVEAHPQNAKYLIAFLRALVNHQQFDEAEKRLAQLEKLNYSSIQVLAIKSGISKQRGQTEQAIQEVRAFADAHPEDSSAAAQLLEKLGDTATAEKLLKQLAEQKDKPEHALTLAAFYGRQNRPQEAIDLCDTARQSKKIPLDVVLAASFSALAFSQPSPDLIQRVESWIDEAEREANQKDKFLNQRGLLWTLAGRQKDAENLYRKAIAANPADVMALNNLAWMLAQTGGDADEALRLIDRAIGVVRFNPALFDTRAVVQIARQEPHRAIVDLNRAIDARRDPNYYFHLARAQFANKDIKAAANSMKTAESLGLSIDGVDVLERNAYTSLLAELQKANTNSEG